MVGASFLIAPLATLAIAVALQKGWSHLLILALPCFVASLVSMRIRSRPTMPLGELGLHLIHWVAAVLTSSFAAMVLWRDAWGCFVEDPRTAMARGMILDIPAMFVRLEMCRTSKESLFALWVLFTAVFVLSCLPLVSLLVTLCSAPQKVPKAAGAENEKGNVVKKNT